MKNPFFTFTQVTIFAIVVLISCQSEPVTSQLSLVDSIASDELYLNYRRADLEKFKSIARGDFDLKAIGKIVASYNDKEQTVCAVLDDDLEGVRGGVKYRDINCIMNTSITKIHQKYPKFSSISNQVRDRFDEMHPEIQKEAKDFISSMPSQN